MAKVTVKYTAHLKELIGLEQCTLDLSPDIKTALEEIDSFHKTKGRGGMLYSATINGLNHVAAMRDGITLKDGDEITLMPLILGG